jgi:L-fuculose-phosphate aldolase
MNFEMLHPADQLVILMGRIYSHGMTTTSGGNLSIRDSDGDVWITPGGIDKGSLKREDIIRVKPDGEIIGIHAPSSELPFHSTIYKRRPDIKAVLHAHPPSLVAFSIVRKIPDTSLIPSASLECGEVKMAGYALPGSIELGDKIADVFASGVSAVVLENHGVVIGAQNLFDAFKSFETLDFCARLEVQSNILGKPKGLSEKQLELYKKRQYPIMEEFKDAGHTSEELFFRREMCDLVKRAYEQQLFTSTQGSFSRRLFDNSFIITPYSHDRRYLEPEDLVRISQNRREKGKAPSRSVMLHKAIYDKHPYINSVILANPPSIMSFAVTDKQFDARLIPESYIMLKTVKKLPFGSSFLQPSMTAQELSVKNPAAIVENDCVIVTGSDLINAFDRLEVMEYSAKSVIYAKRLGEIVKISDDEIKDIEVAFNL